MRASSQKTFTHPAIQIFLQLRAAFPDIFNL